MTKIKKQLFFSSVLMIIYTIIILIYELRNNKLITSNMFDNIVNISQLVVSTFGIIVFLIFSLNKKIVLSKHSKLIMFISILFFIINIVSGILGFIVYGNLDIVKEDKKELPKLKLIQGYNKYIYLFALIFCLIILFSPITIIKGIPGLLFNYAIILFIMIFIFRKQLKRDFNVFIKNFKGYNSLVIKTWIKSLVLLIIISLSIQIITGMNSSTNQETLNKLFNKLPILTALLATLYAPIAEELMFRGIFRKFLNNKWLFILVSGFSFGIVHVIDDFQSVSELLYIFVYGSLGCFLTSLYYKTNNICTNIYFHFLQNSLSVIGMILLYLVR